MYRLFQESPQINKGSVILPEFIYVRGFYLRQLAVLKAYYHEQVRNVPNEHILIKLLFGLNVSFRRDYQNYVDIAGDLAVGLSSQLRMTSSLNHGFAFEKGPFYGSGVTEILIATDSEFDVEDAVVNWRDLEPITVLRHPFTDLSLGRPDGQYEASDETGIAVIAINVAMLALQYRRWVEEEKYASEDTKQTMHQFVSRYPLTNMVASHLDVAVFNRLAATLNEEPTQPFKRVHPFYIPDYTDKVDRVLEKLLDIQRSRRTAFDHMLAAIPLITADTMLDAMRLPQVVPTRQIKWALIVARIPLIKFLVKLNNDTQNPTNKMYLSKLRLALREMRSDRTLHQGLSRALLEEIETDIGNKIEAYL